MRARKIQLEKGDECPATYVPLGGLVSALSVLTSHLSMSWAHLVYLRPTWRSRGHSAVRAAVVSLSVLPAVDSPSRSPVSRDRRSAHTSASSSWSTVPASVLSATQSGVGP